MVGKLVDVNWNVIWLGEGLIRFFLHVQCNIEVVHYILVDFNINLQAVAVEDGLDLLLDEVRLAAGELVLYFSLN